MNPKVHHTKSLIEQNKIIKYLKKEMFLNSLIKKLLYQYKVKITDTGPQRNEKLFQLTQNYKHMFII